MAFSPIQILHSHYDEIKIEAIPIADELEGDTIAVPAVAVTVKSLSQHRDAIWSSAIEFSVNEESKEDYPFRAHFSISAFFALNPSVLEKFESEKEIAKFVLVNGGSILYSSVREMFAITTGRFSFGSPPPLPTLDLRDLEILERGSEESPSPELQEST